MSDCPCITTVQPFFNFISGGIQLYHHPDRIIHTFLSAIFILPSHATSSLPGLLQLAKSTLFFFFFLVIDTRGKARTLAASTRTSHCFFFFFFFCFCSGGQ